VSHLEYFWNEPHFARFLERPGSMARLILLRQARDRSVGSGADQRAPHRTAVDDVRAVMEAAGSARRADGRVGRRPLCSLFAATYPQRTEAW
jgi:hypothetical protein